MGRCAIFIDEGYLRKLYIASRVNVDIRRLGLYLADGDPVLKIYYYYCLPYANPRHPTAEQIEKRKRKQSFIDSIKRHELIVVREGWLAKRGDIEESKTVYLQKGVDVMLAVDLVQMAKDGIISKAVLLTGDGDYVPALEAAKGCGIEIVLACAPETHPPNRKLLPLCDSIMRIDEPLLRGLQVARSVRFHY